MLLDYKILLGDSSADKYTGHHQAGTYNYWLANTGNKRRFTSIAQRFIR